MSGKCICEGGHVIRDEDGQESYLTLVFGKEGDEKECHWFLRVVTFNHENVINTAENFDVTFCPMCGRNLVKQNVCELTDEDREVLADMPALRKLAEMSGLG